MNEKIQLKQDGRFFFGWWIVFLGFCLMLLAYVGFASLTSVFVIPVTEALGVGRGEWMLYMTIQALVGVIASPILGKLMQKGSVKKWVAIGCLCGAVAYIIFSQSHSLTGFYIGALFIGVGFAACAPMPVSILINSWFGGKVKGTASGIAFVGSGLGGFILSPLLNSAIAAGGYSAGYLVLAGVYLIILLPLTLLLAVKNPEDKGFRRMGETEAEVVSDGSALEKRGMTAGQAMKTGEFWLAIISCIMVVFASSAILMNDIGYYVECGIDTAKAASYHGIMLGLLLFGKPIIGFVTDKLGIKVSAPLSTFIFAATFLVMFLFGGSPGILVAGVCICYCLGAPSITVVPPLLINGMFGEKDYGTLVGYINMATSIGGAFGATIAAFIYDATGSYVAFWGVATIGVAIAALLRIICFAINKKNHNW